MTAAVTSERVAPHQQEARKARPARGGSPWISALRSGASLAVTLAGKLSGSFDINATVLLTPEQLDVAVARVVDFRPPGA